MILSDGFVILSDVAVILSDVFVILSDGVVILCDVVVILSDYFLLGVLPRLKFSLFFKNLRILDNPPQNFYVLYFFHDTTAVPIHDDEFLPNLGL